MMEQHDAATRASLSKIAVALAHLWLSACYLAHNKLPWSTSTYWVYATTMEWGMPLLEPNGPVGKGRKRIKVTIELEDCP